MSEPRAWTGPKDSDIDNVGTVLRPPLPPERWPYGPPEAHDDDCRLKRDGLFCDCAASDASAEED